VLDRVVGSVAGGEDATVGVGDTAELVDRVGPFGRFEASVRAEADALSGGFVQRFD